MCVCGEGGVYVCVCVCLSLKQLQLTYWNVIDVYMVLQIYSVSCFWELDRFFLHICMYGMYACMYVCGLELAVKANRNQIKT